MSAIKEKLTSQSSNSTESHKVKSCDYCGLPAVCFGADLAFPKWRCPIHCREDKQFGGVHGDEEYMRGHLNAEGLVL